MSAIEFAIVLYIATGLQFTMLMCMLYAGDCGCSSVVKRILWRIVACLTWPAWLVFLACTYVVSRLKPRKMEKMDDGD